MMCFMESNYKYCEKKCNNYENISGGKDMKIIKNVSYGDLQHPSQMLDIYLPQNNSFAVLIYFHGGGIESGDKSNGQDTYFKDLVNNGIAVVSANYRMYPDAKYPEFIEDAASAVAWSMNNMKNYGKPKAYFIGGSSAGGYLSQMLCFDKRYLLRHNIDSDLINGYIHNSGQPTVHFNVIRERGLDTRSVLIDEAAPLYFVNNVRKYAPMQILFAENDMENRPEQTRLLISTMKHFGCNMDKIDVRYMEGYKHCEYDSMIDDAGKSVYAEIISGFINKYS